MILLDSAIVPTGGTIWLPEQSQMHRSMEYFNVADRKQQAGITPLTA